MANPVQLWAGWQFYKGAWVALKRKSSDMHTLDAVGTSAAYFYNALITFIPGFFAGISSQTFFDGSVGIMFPGLTGHYLEAIAKGRTSSAIKSLLGLRAKTARVVRDGKEIDVSLDDLVVDDIVIVRPGDKVAVDAESRSEHPLGQAILNEAKKRNLRVSELRRFEALAGHGIRALVNGKEILVGTSKLMKDNKLDTRKVDDKSIQLYDAGKTLMFVAIDGKIEAVVGVADTLKKILLR